MKRQILWYWECHATNGKGCFNPDFEACDAKSKKGFKTQEAAEIALVDHIKSSRPWHVWGNSYIYHHGTVFRKLLRNIKNSKTISLSGEEGGKIKRTEN